MWSRSLKLCLAAVRQVVRRLVQIGTLLLPLVAGACAKKHLPARLSPPPDAQAAVDAEPAKAAADSGDLCGYVDRNGKPAIARHFHQVGEFSEGLARVTLHEKDGFIDAKGGYAIAPTFDGAKGFSEGLAAVCVEGRGWGFVDKHGAWVIAPGFAFADSFSGGTAVVEANTIARSVCAGFPGKRVLAGSECEYNESGEEAEGDPGRYFLIDRTGVRLHAKGYHCITRMSEGLAAARRNGKWGYLDRSGAEAIPLRFTRVKPFGEGWAAFWEPDRGELIGGNGRWGFINQRGRVVVRAKYRAAEVGVFSQGLIAMEDLPLKVLLDSPAGKPCVLARGQKAEDLADYPEAQAECAAYLDKRGNLQVAMPYCHFDDVGAGDRSPREFVGDFVEVVTMEPMSVHPFRCMPALTRDVRMFFNRRGELVSPVAALSSRNPEGLVPSCRRRRAASDVDRFTLE